MGDYLTDYKSRSSSVKVQLYLKNYATKEELKNITHVDTSSFALKTNLASLKTEADKLDIPKLTTLPTDVAKLSNKIANDLVETDFNSLKTKGDKNKTDNDNLETKVTTTKKSINSLKTKFDGMDLTKYVLNSNYDTKIGNLELKVSNISGLLKISSFNSKVNELENKIKTPESKPDISNLANKTELKNIENKIPDAAGFVKKTDYATEITSIKNDYVSNAALTSQLNSLKNTHIAVEIEKVNDKVVKNTSDILGFESRQKQKEDTLNDLEREATLVEVFIIILKNLTFFLNQSLNHFVEVVGQFALGNQQEFTMIVTALPCFL